MVTPSILTSVKKMLNVPEEDVSFDTDIVIHINTVFATLQQLGVGPDAGFEIEDKETEWDAFLGTDPRKNNIKSYVYLRVRSLFDPPSTGYHTEAMKEQIKELEWRINVYREETEWVDPDPDEVDEDSDLILDGGGP